MAGHRRALAGPRALAATLIAAFPGPGSLAAPVSAQDPAALGTVVQSDRRVVAPGLDYARFISRPGSGEPVSAHVLWVDLARVDVRHVLALDQVLGQETPTSMDRRYDADAAINGGFSVSNDPWNEIHGDPNGFLVLDGRVVSDPVEPRASAGICRDGEGSQAFRTLRPRTVWTAVGEGVRIPVDGVNRRREPGEIVAYTQDWGRSTITGPEGFEVQVPAGRVAGGRRGGSSRIPDPGFVLSGEGTGSVALAALSPGATLRLEVDVVDLDQPGRPVDLTGCSFSSAGPVIVRDGTVVRDFSFEGFREAFTLARHPRTALGTTRDGTLLVAVVDGRQEGLSVGMTLPELGEFLVSLQVSHGYNLDGGGSTAMVVEHRIVNSPSDGRERRRSDGVLFLARPPP